MSQDVFQQKIGFIGSYPDTLARSDNVAMFECSEVEHDAIANTLIIRVTREQDLVFKQEVQDLRSAYQLIWHHRHCRCPCISMYMGPFINIAEHINTERTTGTNSVFQLSEMHQQVFEMIERRFANTR